MEILYLLVPIALVFLAIAIKLLFWAVNNGQYDDLDTEGYRILFDDDAVATRIKTPPLDKKGSEDENNKPDANE
jgi:cbb3-type cytochrome oxidase maturation protein